MANQTCYLGYDPAGTGKFAAATIRREQDTLKLVSAKIVSCVAEALTFATNLHEHPVAAAIDAPLTWSSQKGGWRRIDKELRRDPSHGNRVMSPNSLMGSVVVQGPALALALANHFPRILITETHPKLTTSMLGIALDPAATREHRVFEALSIVGFLDESSDDLIDAVVASYVAWAAYTEQPRWVNLLAELPDSDLFYPLGEQRSTYYFPWQRTVP